MGDFEKNYELLFEGLDNNKIPVKKYRSKTTNIKVVFGDVVGPLVQGFFCLATEASNDDGLPHILEHVIFLGSEDHPYKGVLDKVATRCLSEGTNAWTDRDHTCYTVTTAGPVGFLNLLPIYLDHILYPILSKSAYVTEVHHITEEGKDAGVVYSEMQSVENTGSNKVYLEMLRNIYPFDSGYRFETGGILENIRTSTNNEKVKDYHRKFYRPENLCLIVTGKIDHQQFFKVLSEYENKIVSKGLLLNFERPWMKSVAPLKSSVVKTVQFPSDDGDEGLVTVAWRGPNINDQFNMTALTLMLEYLTDTPVALLNQTFVEIENPYCGEIDYTIVENLESIFCIEFESVSMDRIKRVQPKLLSLLGDLAAGTIKFDMERMKIVIHNKIVELMSQLEDDPHETLAATLIGDFLYGLSKNDLEARLQHIDILRKLLGEEETFWRNFLQMFLTTKHSVTIIGEPSPAEVKRHSAEEDGRIERRKAELGGTGLEEKNQILLEAIAENNKCPPEDFLMNFKIPNTRNLPYHSIQSYSNSVQFKSIGANQSFDDLPRIPCCFQLDDIQTDFVTINVCIDVKDLPPSLIAYLPLYIEVLFESPIIRNDVEVPYEKVVQQLSRDTVEYSSSLGVFGSRFQPGEFSSVVIISLKVELKKLAAGVRWCGELLSSINFTPERVSTVAKKLTSDIKQQRREADVVVEALAISNLFQTDSVAYASILLNQQNFLKDLQSAKQAKKHLPKLREIQRHLLNLNNVYVHMATDVNKLKESLNGTSLSDIWNKQFVTIFKEVPQTPRSEMKWSLKKDGALIKDPSKLTPCIVGLGSTDSAYLIKVCSCIDDFNHPDVPALLVFCHFISFLEGPMWKLIRGKGLAYSFSMTPDFNEGLLYFRIEQSSDPYEAYKQAIGLIQSITEGITRISQLELECAKCQCIYELIQSIQTPSMSSKQAFSCFMRNIPLSYYSDLMEKVQNVKVEELQMIADKYVSKLLSSNMSTMFIACNIKDMTKLLNKYQTMCQCKFTVFKTVNAITLKK